MRRHCRPREEAKMAKTDAPRIAVLGAGPIGLEAALYGRNLKLPVTLYERGKVGEHLHRWGHVRLFSPFGMNTTPLGRAAIKAEQPKHEFPGDSDCITGREHLAAYLEPLAKTEAIRDCLKPESRVLGVGRRGYLKQEAPGDPKRGQQPFRILVKGADSKERIDEADVVLDCTGTYGQHRWLGDGGLPAVNEAAIVKEISYGLEDILGGRKSFYAGKTVLVVGGGYSAATTVCNLARLAEENAETWITWLTRGGSSQPILRIPGDTLKERDRLAARANTLATRGECGVEFFPSTVIDEIEFGGPDKGFRIVTRSAGKPRTFTADRVIANVGCTPDNSLYRELQVHECYASLGPMSLAAALLKHSGGDCLTIPTAGPTALKTTEPNFFILGSKSYGRNAQFLLRNGFEQVREVFTLILGKADVDPHRKR